MAKPALVVVYEDREVLAALDQALQSRFGADYQVLAATTPVAAPGYPRPAPRGRRAGGIS
jgi:hypothetical protein